MTVFPTPPPGTIGNLFLYQAGVFSALQAIIKSIIIDTNALRVSFQHGQGEIVRVLEEGIVHLPAFVLPPCAMGHLMPIFAWE